MYTLLSVVGLTVHAEDFERVLTAIKCCDLEGFAELIEANAAPLVEVVERSQIRSDKAIAMAIFARFRDGDLSPSDSAAFVQKMRLAAVEWAVIGEALVETIPCKPGMPMRSPWYDQFGAVLSNLLQLGIQTDGILGRWASGWLGDCLRSICWDSLTAQEPDADQRKVSYSENCGYVLPAALVALGADKESEPAWGKERETAEDYVSMIGDPLLSSIVLSPASTDRAAPPQGIAAAKAKQPV